MDTLIFLIEDDQLFADNIKQMLEYSTSYKVYHFLNGLEALSAASQNEPNVVICDIKMPEVDGFEFCELFRHAGYYHVPFLFLTGSDNLSDLRKGMNLGADDYLTKPFNLEELLLRVDKFITKNQKIQVKESIGDTYSFGGNTINFKAQTATTHDNKTVELSKKETMLLKLLIENKGEVVTREKILQVVWGYNVFPTTRTIDNFILSFRKNFEVDARTPKHFQSARCVGYKYTD